MSDYLFSVIIPTYNRDRFISGAIDSVLNQVFTNFELLIIDDGSTDGTKDLVGQYTDPRLKYHFQKNQERSVARNNGIALAKGKYVCFLDSDDEWSLEHLNGIFKFLKSKDYPEGLFYTGMYRYDRRSGAYVTKENRKRNQRRSPLLPVSTKINLPKEEDNQFDLVLKYSILPSTVCCSRKVFKNYQFNPSLRMWEDTELWLRIANEFPLRQINQHSVIINYHEGSTIYELEEKFSIEEAEKEIQYKLDLLNQPSIKNNLNESSINELLFRSYYNHFYHAVQKGNSSLMKYFLKKCQNLRSFGQMKRGYLRMYMDMYRT